MTARATGRLAVVLVVIVAGTVFVALTAAAAPPRTVATGPPPRAETPDPHLVTKGRKLFEVSCSSCHGIDGQGTRNGPTLVGVGAASASFMLTTGRMPLADPNAQALRKPPAFSQSEIDALVAFVASLGPGPAIPDVQTARGNLSEGGRLFRFNCAACHSSTGAGGALSLGHDAPALHVATPTQIGEAIRTGPGQMPIFGPDTLSAHQVDSIARYVGYLQSPDDPGGFSLGRIGPITEGMVALLIGIPLLLFVCVRIEESHERRR